MLTHNEIVIMILSCVFGFVTIFIMGLRLAMRKLRKQQLYPSDYLAGVAILCVMARWAFAIVVGLWGNNNNLKPGHHFTATELYQREVGSKLTLGDRMVYNTYLWIQKSVVLLLYDQLFSSLPLTSLIIKTYWASLLATYLAVQATSFVDCRPLKLFWQVVPDPGPCTSATIQISTFVALNMATDLMLLVFPMPAIFSLKSQPWRRRLQLIGLFSLGIILLIISILRLPVYSNGTSQVRRYTWGSVEQFAAALVANLPTLYGLYKRKSTDQTVISNRSTSRKPPGRQNEGSWASEQQLLNHPHFVAESWRGPRRNDSIEGDNIWLAPTNSV